MLLTVGINGMKHWYFILSMLLVAPVYGKSLISAEDAAINAIIRALREQNGRVTNWAAVSAYVPLNKLNQNLYGKDVWPIQVTYVFAPVGFRLPMEDNAELVLIRSTPIDGKEGRGLGRHAIVDRLGLVEKTWIEEKDFQEWSSTVGFTLPTRVGPIDLRDAAPIEVDYSSLEDQTPSRYRSSMVRAFLVIVFVSGGIALAIHCIGKRSAARSR
ncbi:MAG: hypothetical protein AB1705_08855 [Verrucomicrobiota bacterium]